MRSRRTVRVIALLLAVALLAVLGQSYLTAGDGTSVDLDAATAGERPTLGTSEAAVEARELTVVTTQGFFVKNERADLIVFTREGRVVFHDDRYLVYFDVDPVPGTRWTVEYVAAKHLEGAACEEFETPRCTRNVVERVNVTTGEVTTVFARKTEAIYGTRWHDADRINETHIVVADILDDRVLMVDTRRDAVVWSWNATDAFSPPGGSTAGDWTHLNDVEVLPDGRLMVSLRNLDSVVFIDPGSGIQREWTLGVDDDESILYEQHNPDYIPSERGGPSVLVGDSENNRIVEYRRVDGEWVRSWWWRDVRLQWARDADRLPDGTTLVVDSHGDRVLSVTPGGRVEWTAHVSFPYDVERLGTGDESAGGPAIQERERTGTKTDGGDADGGIVVDEVERVGTGKQQLLVWTKRVLPSVAVNGALYLLPTWMRFVDLLTLAALSLLTLLWGSCELVWSRLSVRSVGTWLRSRWSRER